MIVAILMTKIVLIIVLFTGFNDGIVQDDSVEQKFYYLTASIIDKLDSGKLDEVNRNLIELTSMLPRFHYNWNYSNAVHKVNIVAGRLEMLKGNTRKAKKCLLAAGLVEGSPQLETFGPNMSLAKELLLDGERQIVIEYLKLCISFWVMGKEHLNQWIREIEQGNIPDFGGNIKY